MAHKISLDYFRTPKRSEVRTPAIPLLQCYPSRFGIQAGKGRAVSADRYPGGASPLFGSLLVLARIALALSGVAGLSRHIFMTASRSLAAMRIFSGHGS